MTRELKDICRKLKPVLGNKVDKLWFMYLVEDKKGKLEIESYLQMLYNKHVGYLASENVVLEMPSRNVVRGEYLLGDAIFNGSSYEKFGLRENEFIQHIGVFGRSGSGKTNVAFQLLRSLKKKRKPFLVFDWKRNYRDLLLCPEFENLIVFGIGKKVSLNFGFNPLKPPAGVSVRVWIKKIIEIINHAYYLGEGCAYLLQKALDECYKQCKVYKKDSEYPSFTDVLHWLENYKCKGREAMWHSSALRAVGAMCYGEIGDVLNQYPEVSIEKLLLQDVVLELDVLADSDKTFLIESILLWIHHLRMNQPGREKFKHAILIEEAHHVLLKKKQEMSGGEVITDVILREIRELGESVILLDQHPSLISLPALGNTYCTIAMNLKHRNDVEAASSCLLLDFNDKDYVGKLRVGEGIVRLQGRSSLPFLVRFPLFVVEKGSVSDSLLDQKMSTISHDLYSGMFVERRNKRFLSSGKYSEGEIDGNRSFNGENVDSHPSSLNLSENEVGFLKDVLSKPVLTVMERYKSLGFSRRTGGAVKRDLLLKGLIEMRRIKHNGTWVLLQELTFLGKEFLKGLGLSVVDNDRGGSLEHMYWVERVRKYYERRGYSVVAEYPIGGGKTVDLLVERGDLKFPVEVETGKSDVEANIRKCLDAGFEKVVVVPTRKFILNDNVLRTNRKDKTIELLYNRVCLDDK